MSPRALGLLGLRKPLLCQFFQTRSSQAGFFLRSLKSLLGSRDGTPCLVTDIRETLRGILLCKFQT